VSRVGGRAQGAAAAAPGRSARFLFGAARIDQLSQLSHPTVAFVGRSNVGKSSLLNRLVGQRKLARVSKRPGRTQEINFFLLDERIVVADLPGYGFARVPKSIQAQWKGLVEAFLAGPSALRLVAVLVDARRGVQAEDRQLLEYLAAMRRSAVLVATKIDKLTRSQRKQFAAEFDEDAKGISTVVCSAVTGEGLADLWAIVETACRRNR
jgi:GTP-binding protein